MNILVVDDDKDIAKLYGYLFKNKGHQVTIAHTAEECLKIYSKALQNSRWKNTSSRGSQPFIAIILDYILPDRNGLEVAKEILVINPHQRIIFVSANADGLSDSLKELQTPLEVLQKPVSNQVLTDTVEDKAIYEELKKLKVDIDPLKKAGLGHEALKEILDTIKKRNSSLGLLVLLLVIHIYIFTMKIS